MASRQIQLQSRISLFKEAEKLRPGRVFSLTTEARERIIMDIQSTGEIEFPWQCQTGLVAVYAKEYIGVEAPPAEPKTIP